ncbi:MAG: transporter [Gammaproteobacteria bacterium]|nr:transporter [Gammaproteobacteria bacterium]MBU1776524.1 transporter [Gammaproteobacteria bacterium]MBU1968912.1 transporter [Gammaproteobacteria bacterium]
MDMKQHGYLKWLAAMMLTVAAGGACAEESKDSYLTMMLGYESSSGDYGTTTSTDIVTVPVSALYETGRWAMKLTVPYIRVTGDGTVLVSGGGRGWRATTTTTTTTARTTSSGLGDIVALLAYNVYAADNVDAGIDLAGRVKFGTASKTLGTGMNDYAAQLYGYRAFGDFTPSLVLGYEVLGSSAEVPLDNVLYGTVGADYRFGELSNGGLEYRYVQQASATAAEQRELTLYLSREIGRDTFLRGYLLKGYADGSPDTGFGISLSAVY